MKSIQGKLIGLFLVIGVIPHIVYAGENKFLFAKIYSNNYFFTNPVLLSIDTINKYCDQGCDITMVHVNDGDRAEGASGGTAYIKTDVLASKYFFKNRWNTEGAGDPAKLILGKLEGCYITNLNRALNACEVFRLSTGQSNTLCVSPAADTASGFTAFALTSGLFGTIPSYTCELYIEPSVPVFPEALTKDTSVVLSGGVGSEIRFLMPIPTTATSLTLVTEGDNGDADLYVSRIYRPTASHFEYARTSNSSNESLVLSPIVGGMYNILIRGYKAYNNVVVRFTYD